MQSGGRQELELFGEHFGMPDMFERTFEVHEYDEDEEFEAAGLRIKPVRLPHYTLRTFGFRVSNETTTLAYSGDSGPSERLAELARDVDLFLCEATLERGELDGAAARTPLAGRSVSRRTRRRARSACCSRTGPKELPLDAGLEQAYDGLELSI